MSDVLLVLLEIDLSSHRSIGLFILTLDSQYNVPSEIIATCNLRNDLPGTICMTFVLYKTLANCIISSFFSAPQTPVCMRYVLWQCRSQLLHDFQKANVLLTHGYRTTVANTRFLQRGQPHVILEDSNLHLSDDFH